MLQDNGTCKVLCRTQVPMEDAKFVNDRIKEDYALNWLVDGLPAAEAKIDVKTGDLFYDMGFNLGDDEGERAESPALNNHYEVVLRYLPRCAPGNSIVEMTLLDTTRRSPVHIV